MSAKIGSKLKFAVAVVFSCNALITAAQPVRFVVPFAPGGGADAFARIVSQKMSEAMGEQVVIDNRGGAGGMIGLTIVARAAGLPPTLGMLTTSGLVSMLHSHPDLVNDFQMVSLLGISGYAIVSSRDTTIANLVARAKGPHQFRFGSGGTGTLAHICFEQFLKGAGLQALHVPYKGTAPMLADLVGGQIETACVDMASAMPHIRSGKLRALAVTLPYPNDNLPGVPTLESAGVQGVLGGAWYAVIAPKSMSRGTLISMVAGLKQALSDPQVQARLRDSLQIDLVPAEDVGPVLAEQFVQRQIVRLRPYLTLLQQ